MNHKNWEAIHKTYRMLERLCATPVGNVNAEAGEGREEQIKRDEATLIATRADLRTQLDFLKATLAEQYSERDTYLIIFPIVAHIDEYILNHYLSTIQSGWPSLQKELFAIDNGGEVFFEILDDTLRKPQTSLFIFEVYYYCLNYGFRGRYQDEPVKIRAYLQRLTGKLAQEELAVGTVRTDHGGVVEHRGSRLTGYFAAAVMFVSAYLSLLLAGRNLL